MALPPASDSLSPLGGMLYEFDSLCFQSVRSRRAVLARKIDHIVARRPRARVLSVACGHLREIEWSRAAPQGDVSAYRLSVGDDRRAGDDP
jgi:extracellular factor (EF) 3-hydroxypalmitic acid methyl ester biosynthesis protein